jgi:hypothetical protein
VLDIVVKGHSTAYREAAAADEENNGQVSRAEHNVLVTDCLMSQHRYGEPAAAAAAAATAAADAQSKSSQQFSRVAQAVTAVQRLMS